MKKSLFKIHVGLAKVESGQLKHGFEELIVLGLSYYRTTEGQGESRIVHFLVISSSPDFWCNTVVVWLRRIFSSPASCAL